MENGKDGHSALDLEQAEAARRKQMIREIDEIAFRNISPGMLAIGEYLLAAVFGGNLDLVRPSKDSK